MKEIMHTLPPAGSRRTGRLVAGVPILVLILAACATPAPPPAEPIPQPSTPTPAAASIGSVRVTTQTLNVRKDASASSDVVTQVKKGDRLALLEAGDEWMRVRTSDGLTGWVSAKLVTREGQQASRSRRGCPADSDFRFEKAPMPSFSEKGAHGVVTVDATVDSKGTVQSTKILSNTTGDEALAFLAEREIKNAKFVPPVRNCVARAFIFTYKRAF